MSLYRYICRYLVSDTSLSYNGNSARTTCARYLVRILPAVYTYQVPIRATECDCISQLLIVRHVPCVYTKYSGVYNLEENRPDPTRPDPTRPDPTRPDQ